MHWRSFAPIVGFVSVAALLASASCVTVKVERAETHGMKVLAPADYQFAIDADELAQGLLQPLAMITAVDSGARSRRALVTEHVVLDVWMHEGETDLLIKKQLPFVHIDQDVTPGVWFKVGTHQLLTAKPSPGEWIELLVHFEDPNGKWRIDPVWQVVPVSGAAYQRPLRRSTSSTSFR
jgi:hypothetical protein